MIMYYVAPMMPLYNGFYLFPLSRAVNSNRLIFDPSEVEIHQYVRRFMCTLTLPTLGHAVYIFSNSFCI